MIIKNIKFNEKTMNFNIELDDSKIYKISYDVYEKYNIKKEMDVDDYLCKILISEHDFITAKEIVLRSINYRVRSSQEIRNKLYQSKIKSEIIEKTIDYLNDKGYLDDVKFADEYINQCINFKNYSLLKTKQKLYEKGIDKNLVEDTISKHFTDEVEERNAFLLASKRAKSKDLGNDKEYQKVYRALVSNGFSYDLSRKVLNAIKKELSNEE